MKRILLLKLICLSIFTMWTVIGNSQVKEIKAIVSVETEKNKALVNTESATGKPAKAILPDLAKDKQSTNSVSLSENDNVLSNSRLIPVAQDISIKETLQNTIDEIISKIGSHKIDTVIINGTSGKASDLEKIPVPPVIRTPDIPVITNVADNFRNDQSIVLAPGMNLTPYQPTGWDNKIVLSTVTGTNTSAATIYDNQTIYLDWAAINNGVVNITSTFYSRLYVDGVLTGYYSTPGLNSNYYTTLTDETIGPLSAGTHSFRIVVDSDANVAESNETDNEYTRTFTITASPVCANLTPYQPSGWDNKIVLSIVTGTTTSASVIYDNQAIYLDWAAINNGTCNISSTFYTKLYIDGALIANYSTNGLASNSYAYISDAAIGTLSSGSHTFRIVTDSDGNVNETNESDNGYTRTFIVTASTCANLTPFQPSGWDNKIVLSTVTGTTTSASVIYENQAIYLDWAETNNGSCNISQTFYTKLYIDGVLTSNYITNGLASNSYAFISDAAIGTLSAGSHTFRIVADSDGNVPETNESDNEYTRTFTITVAPACANLTPYQPSGWDNKIVLSTVTGTNTSASIIYDNQTIYLDWAAINSGTCNISQTFYSKLYIDGVLTATYSTPGLASNSYAFISDAAIGPLSTGSHTFRIVTDSNGNVPETNESDNEYTRTFTITASVCVNLTPYQPSGWDNKIVLSTVTGTTTSASTFYDNQTIYLDWAAINNGTCNISQTFYTKLYIDGVLKATYYTTGLSSNNYASISDAVIGPLSAGSHTFRIVIDSEGNVPETNESDNEYSRTISVLQQSIPDIYVTPISLTINQSGISGLRSPSNVFVDNSKNNPKDSTKQFQSEPTDHLMGCLVPDAIYKYWLNRESPMFYPDAAVTSIDWSNNDSPVKNQGGCSSCWAFAATAYIENLGAQTDLSEQVIVSCASSGDCSGGYFLGALQFFQSTGAPAESCYAYTETNGNCANMCSTPPFKERITSVSSVLWGLTTVDNLKAQLLNGPLVVRMLVPTDNTFNGSPGYTGGIYNYNGGVIPDTQGHAVLLVGYDDNQQCFKVKNSWGSGWGESGYFRISYDDVTDDVQFGSYAVNGSGVYTQNLINNSFTISNIGTGNLTITSISSNKGWLTTSGYTGTPFSISPAGSQSVTANVNWALVGSSTQIGTITVASNDPDEPSVTVQVTAIPLSCSLSVTPSNQNVPYSPAGSTTFSVTSNCSWTSISNQTWCTVTPSGSGSGTITANYNTNTSSSTRTANITVTVAGLSPVVVTVTQAPTPPCSLSVTPSNQNVPYSPAGSTTFSVTSTCSWTAVSNQTWCTVTPSGTGNGTITASYTLNSTGTSRVANITVTVSGLTPVVVTLTQSSSTATHFVPVWWPGSGSDHMNLYALTATLDGTVLQPGDEIGIFDGNVCVGMGVLTQVLNGTVILSMVASKDDAIPPAKNGYTPGNTISYKVWDTSSGTEVSNAQASYVSGVGIYAVGATSTFNLSALTSITHNINLTSGWNIMSFAAQPTNMSMLSIVNPLITAGTLSKVQDERGNAIEQLPAPIGWVDNIGLMKVSEGYKVKVTGNTTLSITGQPVTLPHSITLDAGWNIMGYPSMSTQGALPAFNPLITAATLLKVQDEAGNAIEQLPAPIGWIDNIINLTPGHGYKVKTTINTSLIINNSAKGEYQKAEATIMRPTHFKLAYTGNGLDQMNIYLKNPSVGGVGLKTGDEIGVFDRGVCVGAGVVDDPNLKYLLVIASLDDPNTQVTDGFKEGNNFELRLWDNQAGLERNAQLVEVEKGYNKLFEKLGTSVLAVDFETVAKTSLGDAYPNPSTDKTTFTFQLERESKVRLEIYNIEGDLIKVLGDQNMAGGIHRIEWDNRAASGMRVSSGIYFYRLKLNNFIQTKQLVIH